MYDPTPAHWRAEIERAQSNSRGRNVRKALYPSLRSPSAAVSHCEPLSRNPETAYVQLQKHTWCGMSGRDNPFYLLRLWLSYTHLERHSLFVSFEWHPKFANYQGSG
jgi:hypothetical protein